MKKKLLVLCSVLMIAAMAVALTACGGKSGGGDTPAPAGSGADSGEAKTLSMATNAAFPPYEYMEGNEYAGIDIEIAKAIADYMGAELVINDVEFGSIIGGVQSGKYDMGIAGMTVTEERLQRVENSMDVYQEASGLIRGHRKTIAFTQILTFVQRYCLFALTWLVYLSLDLRGAHFVPTIGRQAIVSIASDMLPTPGGLGFNEFVYMRIFTPVFGSELMTTVSLTMSRGFSYYFLVILSGIVTLGVHIYMTVRSHRRKAAEEQAVE